MRLEFERGIVSNVVSPTNRGKASCTINCRKVMLHRDLADDVHVGDDVLLIGLYRKDAFQALALKNITMNKISGIDCTNYILLMGLGFILFIMFGIFGMNEISEHVLIRDIEEAVSFAGLALSIFLIRHVLRVNRALNRVSQI